MSVAFRRESDEEHREPRFERPIPSGPNLVTARGRRLIDERVAALAAELAAATDPAPRERVARELRYWRTRQVTAVEPPPPTGDEVAFGSRVRVRINGAERSFTIVGDDEAAPASGRIAFSAPLARVLIGARAGDELMFGASPIEVLALTGED